MGIQGATGRTGKGGTSPTDGSDTRFPTAVIEQSGGRPERRFAADDRVEVSIQLVTLLLGIYLVCCAGVEAVGLPQDHGDIFTIGAYAGMQLGEIVSRRWECSDLDRATRGSRGPRPANLCWREAGRAHRPRRKGSAGVD